MRTELFDYELPEELIAQRPPKERDGGRLCMLEDSGVEHGRVADFAEAIESGDLVVLNETRVRKARLYVSRPKQGIFGGAKVELLLLGCRRVDDQGRQVWEAMGRGNRPLRPGDPLEAGGVSMVVGERGGQGTFELIVDGDVEALLDREGQMPIPPYMQRQADDEDVGRYQTVFANQLGSAAAPTAGLHLTERALQRIVERGAEIARVVLHVGIGTFRPVQHDDLDEHPMHSEWLEVGQELLEAVERTRSRGGRVVAVGTTVVRALEAAADPARPGFPKARAANTDLLIQPGYRFSVVDALLTNFHMPRSTLLALVSAFAGRDRVLAAYDEAIRQRYAFLSYGDAMWIPRCVASKTGCFDDAVAETQGLREES